MGERGYDAQEQQVLRFEFGKLRQRELSVLNGKLYIITNLKTNLIVALLLESFKRDTLGVSRYGIPHRISQFVDDLAIHDTNVQLALYLNADDFAYAEMLANDDWPNYQMILRNRRQWASIPSPLVLF